MKFLKRPFVLSLSKDIFLTSLSPPMKGEGNMYFCTIFDISVCSINYEKDRLDFGLLKPHP